jgi:hypothetical protein
MLYKRIQIKKENAISVLQIFVSFVYIGRKLVKNLQFRSIYAQKVLYIIISPSTLLSAHVKLYRRLYNYIKLFKSDTQQDAQHVSFLLFRILLLFCHIFMSVFDDCFMEVPKRVAKSG